jgi:hypothetical protein
VACRESNHNIIIEGEIINNINYLSLSYQYILSVVCRESSHIIIEGEIINNINYLSLSYHRWIVRSQWAPYSYRIFCPGFRAQANCHFGLNRVDHGKKKFNSAGLHQCKDP